MYDLLVRGGRVIDGTANPWFHADIAIADGRVAAVGRLDGATAARVVDATARAVAPGFIDIHSHSDFVLPLEDHGETLAPFLAQGITTIVTGNCGYSPAPASPSTLAELRSYTTFLRSRDLPDAWRSFGDFLDHLDGQGVALNVVPMVAHGALRIHEVGFAGRGLDPAEQDRMASQLREALEAGAFGLSSGLLYAPGIFADPEEIERLASVLHSFDAIYTSHIRGSSETLLPATREVIRVGEVNGIRTQHSHIEAFGRANWPKIEEILTIHEAARDRGVDTGFDVIPYVAANTTLLAIFPRWSLDGGVDALLDRLRDPATRERIRRSIDEDLPGWPCWTESGWPHNLVEATGWANVSVMWVESDRNKGLEGRSVLDIATEQQRDPFDVAADLVLEEGGHAMALYYGVSGEPGEEAGLERLLAHPLAAVETDAILTGHGTPHPAAYGAFPRVLGHFSRDRGLFSLEEAVRRMTSLPAQRMGLRDRGVIRAGAAADLVIFDPVTIGDRTTYRDPSAAPSGVDMVVVNGQVVVEHGRTDTSARAGAVLRRGTAG